MKYVRNAWYVAAMYDELQPGELLARTYLGEPLVLFRDAEGNPHALADRCPHRFAPLSKGSLCDGGKAVRCLYHGLEFDGRGTCVHNPHGAVPKAATVKSHPVTERGGLIWLWMGDPEMADASLIPDYSAVTSAPPDATIRGYMPTACESMLLVDNILDLSHIDFLHLGSLGSGALSRTKAAVTELSDRSVHIAWLSSDDLAPRAFDVHLRTQGQPTDQWTEVTWTAPSTMLLAAGAALQGESREAGAGTLNLHLATPESVGRTHYWYWTTRNFAVSPEQNLSIGEMVRNIFSTEDKPMLEAQQRSIGSADIQSLKPVLLPTDAGAVRVRRKLDALLEAESAMVQSDSQRA